MPDSLFADVAHLYKQSSTATISRHRIAHPALGNFCVSLDSFSSMLGESASEDYWLKFLVPLKRLRFEFCAAPFTQEFRNSRISIVLEELQHHLRYCSQLYPDMAVQASAILTLLTDLLNENEDPLLEKLVELTDAEHKVAWVIKESRLIPHVEEVANGFNLSELFILHPLQLKGLICYDQLVVVGPSRWFPENVFTAARSGQIHILIFDWIKDRWKPKKLFANPYKSSGSSNRKYMTVEEHETGSRWNEIDAESLLRVIDKASSVASTLNSEDQDEYEDVEAICVFLEGDLAVFIEAGEGGKTLVIDPDEDADDRVTRLLIKDIQPGTFILVRTSGGGDYIVPVANKIMGNKAQQAREYQKHWKELLRNYVKENGLLQTSIDLLDFGSDIANKVNLRNWIWPRNIRTHSYSDFLAIMKLINLEEKAEEYWNMMGVINKAHHKAGFEIRNSLLDQIRDIDTEILQKQGKMDFKLSDDDEGGLTAFRVESVLPQTVQVSYSRIGQPFRLEEKLWHE